MGFEYEGANDGKTFKEGTDSRPAPNKNATPLTDEGAEVLRGRLAAAASKNEPVHRASLGEDSKMTQDTVILRDEAGMDNGSFAFSHRHESVPVMGKEDPPTILRGNPKQAFGGTERVQLYGTAGVKHRDGSVEHATPQHGEGTSERAKSIHAAVREAPTGDTVRKFITHKE